MTQNDTYMLYNKNMNKIFLLIMLTFISVNIVFASEIVKQITYSNGTTVLICNTNGIIDYCSERDRQNSIVALNNPNIYVTEEINVNKQKIEKQQKLRMKTIKAVREHFNLEDMDYLEKELMQNIRLPEPKPIKEITVQPEQKTEPKPKQDFEPKVKTSIVARPIFKSSYERYEWHMQNGCICQEDRVWLTNYIKSDEYKEIYGKEQ